MYRLHLYKFRLGVMRRRVDRRCIVSLMLLLLFLVLLVLFVFWLVSSRPFPKPPEEIPPGYPQRGELNIIFLETSCGLQTVPWFGLTARQSCAVESAVRHNPSLPVYVLHTCPYEALQLPLGARAVHVPLFAFMNDTPLYDPLVKKQGLAESKYPVEHAADVMRMVALWKYGGIYLDMDFVILRSLCELGWDWVFSQGDEYLANGALSISTFPGSAGQQVVEACLRRLIDFSVGKRTRNGPQLITKVLKERCNTKTMGEMIYCSGFRVFPSVKMYPVKYPHWKQLFLPEYTDKVLGVIRQAYAVHMWHGLSSKQQVAPNSTYDIIAREHCPHAYRAARAGGNF